MTDPAVLAAAAREQMLDASPVGAGQSVPMTHGRSRGVGLVRHDPRTRRSRPHDLVPGRPRHGRVLGAAVLARRGPLAGQGPTPAGVLQAVFLFDEPDQYLPARRQPASKGPLGNLLKRARSAGVGMFLATQSVGDLD